MRTVPDTELQGRGEPMKTEKNDGYSCPVCDDAIPEQFYCRQCGYVPDWRRLDACEEHRKAA
jgi:hypothetical protein